jgi:hypothetical protein
VGAVSSIITDSYMLPITFYRYSTPSRAHTYGRIHTQLSQHTHVHPTSKMPSGSSSRRYVPSTDDYSYGAFSKYDISGFDTNYDCPSSRYKSKYTSSSTYDDHLESSSRPNNSKYGFTPTNQYDSLLDSDYSSKDDKTYYAEPYDPKAYDPVDVDLRLVRLATIQARISTTSASICQQNAEASRLLGAMASPHAVTSQCLATVMLAH